MPVARRRCYAQAAFLWIFFFTLSFARNLRPKILSRPLLKVIVLSKDRPQQLKDLLQSLETARYDRSRVALHIRIDGNGDQNTLRVAQDFQFTHGPKYVYVSPVELGLARSWYNSWIPEQNERAIILEDDILLSPDWFVFLRGAWQKYESYEGLAGISLQRQTLVPYLGHNTSSIVNNHEPFLYRLVGSIAFSPHPEVWRLFIRWINLIDLDSFNVSTPGLVTSDWWNKLDKRHMWTQHFIYFCVKFDLYTLYVNAEDSKTLAAHTRAKGAHFQSTLGPDFGLVRAGGISLKFPDYVKKFDWDGIEQKKLHPTGDIIVHNTILSVASNIQSANNFVYLMFVNDGFVDFVRNWFCNVRQVNKDILLHTVFVTTGAHVALTVADLNPDLHVFTLCSQWTNESSFGTYAYYRIVTERLKVQEHLLSKGINVFVIEADQIWLRDIHPVVSRHFANNAEIVAGEENGFGLKNSTGQSRICGGFFGVRSTPKTVVFFKDYLARYEAHLEHEKDDLSAFEDDQAFLTRLALDSGITLSVLSSCEYANGLWFKAGAFRALCPDPFVLHNNYIIGADEKMQRLHEWDYWFSHGSTGCNRCRACSGKH